MNAVRFFLLIARLDGGLLPVLLLVYVGGLCYAIGTFQLSPCLDKWGEAEMGTTEQLNHTHTDMDIV